LKSDFFVLAVSIGNFIHQFSKSLQHLLEKEQIRDTFLIYRSSAGSGKTYKLATEFVSLAISDPNLFNKILAVTFTNKATKEMKERILDFLAKIASKEDPALITEMGIITGLSEDVITQNAAIVNDKILHNYSQFSISTIDAFFQKIVKSFAKELGLLGSYKVELDQGKIMDEIIDQIIDDLGKEKELTGWMVDFSFSKVDENRAWDIRPEIESLAYEVFRESFREVEDHLSQVDDSAFRRLLQQVRIVRKKFEDFMTSKAREALHLIERHGLGVDDFSWKSGGPAGYFERIIIRADFDPKKLVREVCAEPDKWSTKTSPRKDEIKNVAEAGLQDVTQALVDYYDQHNSEYITALEIQRNIYVFGILSRIIDKLKLYRQEHDVMLISDVAVFLNKIIAENETPFIYEKTGTWYRHYLIDEFQDTSGYQWQNFRPLVGNGLSEHQRSLLVGDGKQSIYRWRGGDWNLILHKVGQDLSIYQPKEVLLDTNWRSDRKIVEFNNSVFSYLSTLIADGFASEIEELSLAETEKEHLVSMSGDVQKLYHDVVQKVTDKNLAPSGGRIEVNAYQKTDDGSWKETVLEELPKTIERLQDQGFEARDIAVLVRKSDDGKRVIERLLRYKNSEEARPGYCYDAVSNESLFLANSSAIRLMINTIKYALNPEDAIARAEISFNCNQLNDEGAERPELNDLGFVVRSEVLPTGFEEEIRALIHLPVYEMIERIIGFYQLVDEKFKGYLQAFQDIVLEYFADESRDLNDFLEWWEEKGKRESIQLPDSMNAIRIMTIHKSKGLEFKALIIPFCDWKLDHEATKNNILWCTTDKKPFEQAGFLPLKYGKSLADSYFSRDYYQEKIKAYIDNLNLLYVALTRAENVLIVNCPPQSRSLTNAGDLMVKALEKIDESSSEELKVQTDTTDASVTRYSIGDETATGKEREVVMERAAISHYQTSDWRLKAAIRKRGGGFFESGVPERKSRINYGLLAHEILASVKSEKEASTHIDRYFTDGIISREEHADLSDQLNMIFSNPQVRGWFNTSFEVKTEIPIITRDDREKRPDRVIIDDKRAIIIDFKTGMEKSADRKQVLEYRDLLFEMGFEQVESYLLYLAQNKVIKVS
jgi:ATP-dependent exoDNAse (exonuclease V) beta subunit